ncbi:hypothetical protein TYRP_015939, partial [Tyrophagus putrescentiae]
MNWKGRMRKWKGNQEISSPETSLTTFLLKVIDSDRLPVMLSSRDEQGRDGWYLGVEGEGEVIINIVTLAVTTTASDKDHYGIRGVGLSQGLLLTEEEGDRQSRHFQAKLRLTRLRTTGIAADEKRRNGRTYYERKRVDLELVELKRKWTEEDGEEGEEKERNEGNRSATSAEIITLKELCAPEGVQDLLAQELALIVAGLSTSRVVVNTPHPNTVAQVVSIKIKEPEEWTLAGQGSSIIILASASPQPERIAPRYRLSTGTGHPGGPVGALRQRWGDPVRSPKKN